MGTTLAQKNFELYSATTHNIYEFASYAKVLDRHTHAIIPYEMWDHLRVFLHYLRDTSVHWLIVGKARQLGISWSIALDQLFECHQYGTEILDFSQQQDDAADILAKSHFINDQMPEWLRLKTTHDGKYYIKFTNESRLFALPSTPDAGHGHTANRVYRDELEKHDYPDENFLAVKPTVEHGGKLIDVTTIDKTKPISHFKRNWEMVKQGELEAKLLFFAYDCRPGRSEAWRAKIAKEYPLVYMLDEDYPRNEAEAFSPISGASLFDMASLKEQLNNGKDMIPDYGCVFKFKAPEIGVYYVAGGDVGEGVGLDGSFMGIVGTKGLTPELVACVHSKNLNIDNFSYHCKTLLDEYFKPMIYTGADPCCQDFCKSIQLLGYPSEKVYIGNVKKMKAGVQETHDSKERDIIDLARLVKAGFIIPYKPAVAEMFSFQIRPNGRYEAAKGSNDDCVLGLAKVAFALKQTIVGQEIPVDSFF